MNSLSQLKMIKARILIKPSPMEEKTKGGIIIPDQAKEKPEIATVILAGPGKLNEKTGEREPMNCKVGDRILYPPDYGVPMEIGGEKYLMMNDFEAWAVIE